LVCRDHTFSLHKAGVRLWTSDFRKSIANQS
jgi:hypothetical protein